VESREIAKSDDVAIDEEIVGSESVQMPAWSDTIRRLLRKRDSVYEDFVPPMIAPVAKIKHAASVLAIQQPGVEAHYQYHPHPPYPPADFIQPVLVILRPPQLIQ
jgi:hypothetical protein